jgi:manganese/zinc/iron transport system permease protein
MEHILTPEIEAKLDAYLNFPTTDPHQSIIPRDEK